MDDDDNIIFHTFYTETGQKTPPQLAETSMNIQLLLYDLPWQRMGPGPLLLQLC